MERPAPETVPSGPSQPQSPGPGPSQPQSPAPGGWQRQAPPAQWPAPPPQWQPSGSPQNALAIIGLVCSISSLATLFVFAPFTLGFSMIASGPLAIAGLVCGLVGRQKVDAGELATGRGLAQAGFVLGIVSLVLHALAVVVGVVLLGLVLEAIDDFDIPEPDAPHDDIGPSV